MKFDTSAALNLSLFETQEIPASHVTEGEAEGLDAARLRVQMNGSALIGRLKEAKAHWRAQESIRRASGISNATTRATTEAAAGNDGFTIAFLLGSANSDLESWAALAAAGKFDDGLLFEARDSIREASLVERALRPLERPVANLLLTANDLYNLQATFLKNYPGERCDRTASQCRHESAGLMGFRESGEGHYALAGGISFHDVE